MSKTFYITTAIDYTNSPPHIGHAYEKVLADVIARYQRLKGEKVFFLTGVDQHGQKVQQSAAKAGVAPAEFVKEVTQKFVDLWEKLDVKYDGWAETTTERHKKVVQGMLQRLWDEKQIYKDKQAGYYSVRQEQFLTDKERGPDGEFGPEWGQVEFREEENYYFKLSNTSNGCSVSSTSGRRQSGRHSGFSRDRTAQRRRKTWRRSLHLASEIAIELGNRAAVRSGLRQLRLVRRAEQLHQLRRLRSEDRQVQSQSQEFLDRWPALQIIGKDILVPAHGIYWPIMLHAVGFPDETMPQLLVHGWWNLGGAKMSKSAGNIVDPNALFEKYSAEALRYYLMSDIATGKDADFSEQRLVERYNSDLANSLGNLLNRALNMTHRYRNGQVKAFKGVPFDLQPQKSDETLDLLTGCRIALGRYRTDFMDFYEVSDGLKAPFSLVQEANYLVEYHAPWQLAKNPNEGEKLSLLLFTLVEALRIIAILISPILPRAAHGIFDQLNWKMEFSGKEARFSLSDAEWGDCRTGMSSGSRCRYSRGLKHRWNAFSERVDNSGGKAAIV